MCESAFCFIVTVILSLFVNAGVIICGKLYIFPSGIII